MDKKYADCDEEECMDADVITTGARRLCEQDQESFANKLSTYSLIDSLQNKQECLFPSFEYTPCNSCSIQPVSHRTSVEN